MKDFKDRFNLPDSLKEAEDRFINRTHSFLIKFFHNYQIQSSRVVGVVNRRNIYKDTEENVAYRLGKKVGTRVFDDYLKQNIYNCMEILEILNPLFKSKISANYYKYFIDFIIQSVELEPKLNLRWVNDCFLPGGAKELDKNLVDDVLDWLSEPKYHNIRNHYASGLSYLLRGKTDVNDLISSIHDAYKTVETLSQFVLKNQKKLADNREKFISELKLSRDYSDFMRSTLKEYIALGDKYRHGNVNSNDERKLKYDEVESFVYFTGVIIRLAILRNQSV
jgi:hypothetical protein